MDYVFVTLGDSVVESVRVGEKPVKLELKDGDTRFTKGGFAHKAVNLSDRPFVNVTVELKKKINDGDIDCGDGFAKSCGTYAGGGKESNYSWHDILRAKGLTVEWHGVSGHSVIDLCGDKSTLIVPISGVPIIFSRFIGVDALPEMLENGTALWVPPARMAPDSCKFYSNGKSNFVTMEFD
jgi:hypothetical protein